MFIRFPVSAGLFHLSLDAITRTVHSLLAGLQSRAAVPVILNFHRLETKIMRPDSLIDSLVFITYGSRCEIKSILEMRLCIY